MTIERHHRRLNNGEERIYTYQVNPDGSRRSLSIRNGSDSDSIICYRSKEIRDQGFLVSAPGSGTAKQTFMAIADDLNIDTETLEGKAMTTQQLQEAIAEFLHQTTAFLILDDAHRFPVSIRCWLEKLHEQEQPMLLLALQETFLSNCLGLNLNPYLIMLLGKSWRMRR